MEGHGGEIWTGLVTTNDEVQKRGDRSKREQTVEENRGKL